MTSMTGYSYIEKNLDSATVSVEFKSVNSRFLDLNINMGSYLNAFEAKIRSLVSEKINRGKVDLNIRIKNLKKSPKISVNAETALEYFNAFSTIAKTIGKSVNDIPLSLIVNQEGVLETDNSFDAEEIYSMVESVLKESLEKFYQDRVREGENLKKDLLEKLSVLEKAASFFKEWQPKMEGIFKEQITSKFKELLGNGYDEQRVLTETAALLVKYTINEEIVRLHSHLENLKSEIENNSVPGKKIDFLCQEIGREINTIGSKNQFKEVGEMVVTAKDALENIREQSKNVE